MKKIIIASIVVTAIVAAVAAWIVLRVSPPVSTLAVRTTEPATLELGLKALNATSKTSTTVTVEDPEGKFVERVLKVPSSAEVQQLERFLAIDDMLICDTYGLCRVVKVPLNAEEQAVADGTGGEVSVRGVYNADQPGGPVQTLDRIYGRAILQPTDAGERWYRDIDFGVSWDAISEVTITRGAQHCNSVAVTANNPGRIIATLDNSTCDGDGQPIVVRWSAMVIENDLQSCPTLNAVEPCVPLARITVLPAKRKGYMVIYGDNLASAYQANVTLGQPLP